MHGVSHNDQFIRRAKAPNPRYYGLHFARVTDIKDPDGQGRIRVRPSWLEDEDQPELESDWLTRVLPWAGPTNMSDRKRVFDCNWPLPEVGSLVVIGFNGGDKHDGFFMGQPQYKESKFGAPPSDKDKKTDWSWRMVFQNGLEIGAGTEGDTYLNVPANLRIKVNGSIYVSSRGVITLLSLKIRAVAYSVLRLIGATIDQTNYPRPDEAAELREMAIDAFTAPQGRQDPGIGKIPDLQD
jgi:hypothetical protein